jgi:SynChlorMet cassette protein ScmD
MRKPRANPEIVFREESDDVSLLFNPADGSLFGLNPVGVFIWKRLDGRQGKAEILEQMREDCRGVPADAGRQLDDFLEQLAARGLVVYDE